MHGPEFDCAWTFEMTVPDINMMTPAQRSWLIRVICLLPNKDFTAAQAIIVHPSKGPQIDLKSTTD